MDARQASVDLAAAPEPVQDSAPIATDPATICFPFAGGSVGGSHISAAKLIQGLDRCRFTPLIVLHETDGAMADLLRKMGLPFERAPVGRVTDGIPVPQNLRRFFNALRHAAPLTRFLRERDVRIVHTNDGIMHACWAIPARLAGAQLVWHHRGNPRARGLRFLAPLVANRVISVSRYAAPRPGLISAAGRTAVIHSPFDSDVARPNRAACRAAAIAEMGVSPETHILGFFGHFSARKRPLLFVDAIAAVRRRAPDLPIVGAIFGETRDPGLDYQIEERATALGITKDIRMMGFRWPGEPWIAACDQNVVTAIEEPFGRTLIEAMLLGTPIVAADSGGNSEAIRDGETGLLATPEDAESFADAILSLLRDPERARRIADTAEVHARASFGVDRHVSSVSEIYRQLLAA